MDVGGGVAKRVHRPIQLNPRNAKHDLNAFAPQLLNERLAPFRAKREELTVDPRFVDDLLADGSTRASQISDSVMAEVRSALKF